VDVVAQIGDQRGPLSAQLRPVGVGERALRRAEPQLTISGPELDPDCLEPVDQLRGACTCHPTLLGEKSFVGQRR
jgi:hypothetical protein